MARRRIRKGRTGVRDAPRHGSDAPPSRSRPRGRRRRRGVVPTTPPLPLIPPRQSATEAATFWPAARGPLCRVEATGGGGGRGRGGELVLPSIPVNGGKMNFLPTRLTGQESVDPGPVDQGQLTLRPVDQGPNRPLDSTRDKSGPAL
ncbi:hypothetical protein Sjap_022167 [Stephania japonica]|uniref:Uncharacterized protein n=1 Tax=Stephania japonica TaxID=461633 RepID=A0AAP0END7_9MAGN